MRITRDDVILTASEIADEMGLNQISLKIIAERLHIKTPSLYNHISSLDELLHEIAHKGMKSMNTEMGQAAIGKAGDDAIKALGSAYLKYTVHHPGIYETIQWAFWHSTDETNEIFEAYQSLLTTLILSGNFPAAHLSEILTLLTGFLHGYITMNLRFALKDYARTESSLCEALDTILMGLHQKYT